MDALNPLNLDRHAVASLDPEALRLKLEAAGFVSMPAQIVRPMPAQSLAPIGWVGRLSTWLRGVSNPPHPTGVGAESGVESCEVTR